MATNVFKGREGQLVMSGSSSSSGAALGRLRNVSIDVTMNRIDATSFDSSGWGESLDGTKSFTVTAEALVLSTAATDIQDDMRSALSSGTRKYFRVKNSTGTGSQTYAGWGYVGGWRQTFALEDVELHGFTVFGDGKLTES